MDGPTAILPAILPARSLGPLHLGASLHEVTTLIKEDKQTYPAIHLHHSSTEPVNTPVVIVLPQNGLRLRFDGPDQRLRLIEVMDFRKARLAYRGSEIVKTHEDSIANASLDFRRCYTVFGASFPGEYHAPKNGGQWGSYVVSWTGLAFTFPLQDALYHPEKDHVAMLGSSAAQPATQMALFEGNSWPEARKELFVRTPTGARSSTLSHRSKDQLPAEVEYANIEGNGKVQLIRTPPSGSFLIILNQTTPQDLVTELGPPDAVRKRDPETTTIQQPTHRRASSMSKPVNGRGHTGSQPSSYSSTGTDTFDADFSSGEADDEPTDRSSRETFWCYFHHGMDVLIGPPSASTSTDNPAARPTPLSAAPHLVVTKLILHGNVPGSYTFNRHRRLRWTIPLPSIPYATDLNSEANFNTTLKPALLQAFEGTWPESEMARGKVVNRTWGGSPSDSSFFLPDAGEDLVEGLGSEQWLGNTRVYSFPGLGVEVGESGVVCNLSVC